MRTTTRVVTAIGHAEGTSPEGTTMVRGFVIIEGRDLDEVFDQIAVAR